MIFIVSVIMLTGIHHVPRNNALDRIDAESQEGQRYWQIYRREWARMNHVRTIAPAATAVLLAISLVV